jgi:hypothetical protein
MSGSISPSADTPDFPRIPMVSGPPGSNLNIFIDTVGASSTVNGVPGVEVPPGPPQADLPPPEPPSAPQIPPRSLGSPSSSEIDLGQFPAAEPKPPGSGSTAEPAASPTAEAPPAAEAPQPGRIAQAGKVLVVGVLVDSIVSDINDWLGDPLHLEGGTLIGAGLDAAGIEVIGVPVLQEIGGFIDQEFGHSASALYYLFTPIGNVEGVATLGLTVGNGIGTLVVEHTFVGDALDGFGAWLGNHFGDWLF